MKLVRISPFTLQLVVILLLHGLVYAVYAESFKDLQSEPRPKWGHPGLEQSLWRAATFPGKILADSKGLSFTSDGNAIVVLVPAPGQLAASIDTTAITHLGGRVLSASRHLIRAALPPKALIPATKVRGVTYIRTPVHPQPQQPTDIHRRMQQAQPKLHMRFDSEVAKNSPSTRVAHGWFEPFIHLNAVGVGDVVSASISCVGECCDLALVRQKGDSTQSLVAWALPPADSKRHLRFLVADEGSYALAVWQAAGACSTVELFLYSHEGGEREH